MPNSAVTPPAEADSVAAPQAAAVDPQAFAALQTALEPGVRRFLRRLLGDQGDMLTIDDLTQDTFIALYRRLTHPQAPLPAESATPYVYGIARHLAYAEIRRTRCYALATADDRDALGDDEALAAYAVTVDPAPQPDETAHWLLLSVEVRRAIDRLPPVQREALILFSEEGLNYQEIALATGATVGTVASRIHYAKRGLRGLLSANTLDAIENT